VMEARDGDARGAEFGQEEKVESELHWRH